MLDFDPHAILLYEDHTILVISKPAGLLSLRDGYDKELPHLVTVLSPVFGRLWMVHRLDRDTSGVMILARTAEAHHTLNDQFREREIHKIYHALLTGAPPWEEIQADAPLRKDGDRRHRTTIDPQRGKPALTTFRVLERLEGYTLVEARPFTGYTHQIRAHAAGLGFPLAGDSLYGRIEPLSTQVPPPECSPALPFFTRPMLHALSITFQHPALGEMVTFSTPYPRDFADALIHLQHSGR